MSSKLYELGNLKKDLEDAKVAFRNAITYIDGQEQKTYQVYIYTLCEHLAELFAKLSNIRMSHEIYGFKHPHCQWEGILALDVWYNLLYREIDAKYPFNDNYLNMNPMQRRKRCDSLPDPYVLMDNDRKLFLLPNKTCKWEDATTPDDGLEWMEDETSDEFVYIWDSNLWVEYYNNSQKITDTRKECTTPRGVLAKVYRIVKGLEYKWETYLAQLDSDEDYMWFKQPGKVYSHWDKWDESNKYTKYVNLHLGRAYDVMSGKEYFDLTTWGRTGTNYTKPKFSDASLTNEMRKTIKNKMVKSGFKTLVDAFAVVQNEHLFNVFNSNDNVVEEFNETNAKYYSQSQCAIALERVFSRIYKYLQFKSTTSETFQRHINIDSGYKYLTTESLKNSDHGLKYYYDPDDEKKLHIKSYLRYLKKLNEYVNSTSSDSGIGLTAAEKAILKEFCDILSKQTLDWLDKKWDLCPLLQRASEKIDELSPRKLMSRAGEMDVNEYSQSNSYNLTIVFGKPKCITGTWKA